MLALDPPLAERATIGGIVATNAFGPLRTRYGSVRDLIIGISIVRADGTSRARRRQGRQERRRLRSAEADGRLARHARHDRHRDVPPASAARRQRQDVAAQAIETPLRCGNSLRICGSRSWSPPQSSLIAVRGPVSTSLRTFRRGFRARRWSRNAIVCRVSSAAKSLDAAGREAILARHDAIRGGGSGFQRSRSLRCRRDRAPSSRGCAAARVS